jgi:hypothetical protein
MRRPAKEEAGYGHHFTARVSAKRSNHQRQANESQRSEPPFACAKDRTPTTPKDINTDCRAVRQDSTQPWIDVGDILIYQFSIYKPLDD